MNMLKPSLVNNHHFGTQQQSLSLKMFVGNDPETLEYEVNQWLLTSNRLVRHATQSQCERGGKFVLVVSLYYEEG